MNSINIVEILKTPADTEVSGDRQGHFWSLHEFEGGGTWVGRWKGESPWERHSKGDEFLYVLEGEVEVILITDQGKKSVLVSNRGTFVVPRNHWHKQVAKDLVLTMGATPGVTDHSESEPQYSINISTSIDRIT